MTTAHRFIAGFFLVVILVGTMAGFKIVDLRTNRFIPGMAVPMMAVVSLERDRVEFVFMGDSFHADLTAANNTVDRIAEEYRGLIPAHMNMAAELARWLAETFTEN